MYALGMLLRELLTAGRAHGTTGVPDPAPGDRPNHHHGARSATRASLFRPQRDAQRHMGRAGRARRAESRVRPVKPRSPVTIRSRPPRFPLILRIAAAIVTAGVIAVIVWLASSGRIVSHFLARVTAPALTVAPVERSLSPPPAQPLPTEPASVPSSATATPDGTSTRPESHPVEDASPVAEPAPAVAKPAPAPVAVPPERVTAPASAPVVDWSSA